MSARVKSIIRPVGESAAPGPGEPGAGPVAGDHLRVRFDLDDGDRWEHAAILKFDDYAGLELEWNTGVATSTLDSSIDTYIAALSVDDELTSAQESYMGTTKTYPAP